MTKKKSQRQQQKEDILRLLGDLAGKQVRDDEVTYEGTKFLLPTQFKGRLNEAAKFLVELHEQLEQTEAFSRVFKYRPWDGAYAVERVTRELTGTGGLARTVQTFFGPQPPQRVTINVGPHETEQVLWGVIDLPIFEGQMTLGTDKDDELGLLFRITLEAPRKHAAAIEGFFAAVEDFLSKNSIYQGQAIDAKDDPDFIDTEVIDPSRVVYSDQLRSDLDALVWRFVRDREALAEQGIPFKRAVVLYGPYGTGKTETANTTAKYCVENDVTFIKVRAGKDDLGKAMQTARLLQPSVVFFEDVDTVAANEEGNQQTITRLLDLFDGMDAKQNDVMVVLTTNHIDRIHKGMMRPGRIDAAIQIGLLDAEGIHKMAVNRLGEDMLDPQIDWERVFAACSDYTPAFVNEALKRVYLYHENGGLYTERDLVAAAEGLRSQHSLMEDARDTTESDPLSKVLGLTVRKALNGSGFVETDDPDYVPYHLSTEDTVNVS